MLAKRRLNAMLMDPCASCSHIRASEQRRRRRSFHSLASFLRTNDHWLPGVDSAIVRTLLVPSAIAMQSARSKHSTSINGRSDDESSNSNSVMYLDVLHRRCGPRAVRVRTRSTAARANSAGHSGCERHLVLDPRAHARSETHADTVAHRQAKRPACRLSLIHISEPTRLLS